MRATGSETAGGTPRLPSRRWLPRPTLRLRLTLLYGGLFLAAGAVLLAITYELVAHSPTANTTKAFVVSPSPAANVVLPQPVLPPGKTPGVFLNRQVRSAGGVTLQAYAGRVNATFRRISVAQQDQLRKLAAKAHVVLSQQQSAQLGALLTRSGIALGIMALVSIGLGWLMAGRALRPVRTMSARARGISERNLHERLGLQGPEDELKELGDTFDELLARLEAAFESQRRFVASASHELRTPITLERALVEVALADPDATVESLRGTCERVLGAGERQERLIEALLTLARSERGLESRHELDLGEVAAEAVSGVRRGGIRVESELGEARTMGDPLLIERLVSNLLDNAVQYNRQRDGWVSIWTGIRDRRPLLRVGNSGPVLTAEDARAITEPFRRLDGDPTGNSGLGLGLSIVVAIARAHGAELSTTPRAHGGLDIEVRFPVPVQSWVGPTEPVATSVAAAGGVPLAS